MFVSKVEIRIDIAGSKGWIKSNNLQNQAEDSLQ